LVKQHKKYSLSRAFAGYLDILSHQKSALWAGCITVWAKFATERVW